MEADKKSKKKEEHEEEGSEEEEEEEEEETLETSPAMLDKYKAAANIAQETLKHVIKLCVAGANIVDICAEGDKKVDELVRHFQTIFRLPKFTTARNQRSPKRVLLSLLASA
jgi:hypothetical protein